MGHVFISYLREDKARVSRIAKALKDMGADVWWDQDNLSGGDHWRENISKAIKGSDYFVPCFSAGFRLNNDRTMEKELHIAVELFRDKLNYDGKWILPVKLEQCEIPKLPISTSLTLADLHWVLLDANAWQAGIVSIGTIVIQRERKIAREELIVAAHNRHDARVKAVTERHHVAVMNAALAMQANDRGPVGSPTIQSSSADTGLYEVANLTLRQAEDRYTNLRHEYERRFKEDFNPEIDFNEKDYSAKLSNEHQVAMNLWNMWQLRFNLAMAALAIAIYYVTAWLSTLIENLRQIIFG